MTSSTTAPTTTEAPTTTQAPTTTTELDDTVNEGGNCDDLFEFKQDWGSGAAGTLTLKFPQTVSSWTLKIEFSEPVDQLEIWNGVNSQCNGNVCTFDNESYNGQQNSGNELKMDFVLRYPWREAGTPQVSNMLINDENSCSGTGSTTSASTTTPASTTPSPSSPTTPGPSTTTTAGPSTTTT